MRGKLLNTKHPEENEGPAGMIAFVAIMFELACNSPAGTQRVLEKRVG
jgi:hypothetical protein